MKFSILLLNSRSLSISLYCTIVSLFPPISHWKREKNFSNSITKEELEIFGVEVTTSSLFLDKRLLTMTIIRSNFFLSLNFLIRRLRIGNINNGGSKFDCSFSNFLLTKQYLRKFKFDYQIKYAKYFPNNLHFLSTKKVNMLAIKNIFILQGL